jgi:hypothetical protein
MTEIIHGCNIDNIDNAIGGMLKTMQTGLKCLLDSAEVYAALAQRHGLTEINERIARRAPHVPAAFLSRLLAIGEGRMDERLIYGSTKAAELMRKMPISAQKEALDGPVAVYDPATDTTRAVEASKMSSNQARLAFTEEGIRSVIEQQHIAEVQQRERDKVLADHKHQQEAAAGSPKWEIVNGILHVYEECSISLDQIAEVSND